jgi:predicted aspartyl protease
LAGFPNKFSGANIFARVCSELSNPDKPQLVIRVKLGTAPCDLAFDQEPTYIPASALVDTGASKTVVCSQLLAKLHAEKYSIIKMKTANGEVKRYLSYVSLALLDDDKVEFANFEGLEVVEIPDIENEHCRMLVGMDVLGTFSSVKIAGFQMEFSAE